MPAAADESRQCPFVRNRLNRADAISALESSSPPTQLAHGSERLLVCRRTCLYLQERESSEQPIQSRQNFSRRQTTTRMSPRENRYRPGVPLVEVFPEQCHHVTRLNPGCVLSDRRAWRSGSPGVFELLVRSICLAPRNTSRLSRGGPNCAGAVDRSMAREIASQDEDNSVVNSGALLIGGDSEKPAPYGDARQRTMDFVRPRRGMNPGVLNEPADGYGKPVVRERLARRACALPHRRCVAPVDHRPASGHRTG